MRLQRRNGHAAVPAGIHTVAGMRAAHKAVGPGQPPLPGQRQVLCCAGQCHLQIHALAAHALAQRGLQHRLAGHERAAHVGKQGGWQFQPGHQSVVGQVSQVMAGYFSASARAADDGDMRQGRVEAVQTLPAQAQLLNGRGAKRSQQYICFGQLAVQGLLAGSGFQVGSDGFHALVQLSVGSRAVVLHRVASGRLELDAARAHLAATHQRRRAGQVQRQAEQAQALEGFQCGWGRVL